MSENGIDIGGSPKKLLSFPDNIPHANLTNEQVDLLLSGMNSNLINSILQIKEDGIYFDLSFLKSDDSEDKLIEFRNELKKFFQDLILSSKFINGFNRPIIELILYGEKNDILQNGTSQKIGVGFKDINLKLIDRIYGFFRFNLDQCNEGNYSGYLHQITLPQVKDTVGTDNYRGEMLDLNFDDFFVYHFYSSGIIFGYDYEGFLSKYNLKNRLELNNREIHVASKRNIRQPSPGSIHQNFSLSGGKFSFAKVPAGTNILTYTFGEKGIDGISIRGDVTRVATNTNLAIGYDLVGTQGFIEVTKRDKTETLKALQDVCVTKDSNGNFIFSVDGLLNRKVVGDENGNLEVDVSVIQESDLRKGAHIRCKSIEVKKGMLEGEITAAKGIKINPSSSGSVTLNGATLRSNEGEVISIGNNTLIHNGTKIIAVNGKVEIDGDIEHCTIYADEVVIKGKATNCTILGRVVKLKENDGSRVLGESIVVGSDNSEQSDYVLAIFAGISPYISVLEFKRKTLENQIKKGHEEYTGKIDKLKKTIIDLLSSTTEQSKKIKLLNKLNEINLEYDQYIKLYNAGNLSLQIKLKEVNDKIDRFSGLAFSVRGKEISPRIALIPFILDKRIAGDFSVSETDFEKIYNKLEDYFSISTFETQNTGGIILDGEKNIGLLSVGALLEIVKKHSLSRNSEHRRRVDGDRIKLKEKSGIQTKFTFTGENGKKESYDLIMVDYSNNGASFSLNIKGKDKFKEIFKGNSLVTLKIKIGVEEKDYSFYIVSSRIDGENMIFGGFFMEFGIGRKISTYIDSIKTL